MEGFHLLSHPSHLIRNIFVEHHHRSAAAAIEGDEGRAGRFALIVAGGIVIGGRKMGDGV